MFGVISEMFFYSCVAIILITYSAYLTYRAFKTEHSISSVTIKKAVIRAIVGGALGFAIAASIQWFDNYLTDFVEEKLNPYIMIFPMLRILFASFIGLVAGSFIGIMTTNLKLTKKRLIICATFCAVFVLLYFNIHENPLPAGIQADRIFVNKSDRNLYLIKGEKILKRYRVSLGRMPEGRKIQQNDNKTPEGLYIIDFRRSKSAFHLALHISYPNDSDIANATAIGVSPGGDIMIHGIKNGLGWIGRAHRLFDWTRGCIAVTNAEIEELWRAVPDGSPIKIVPEIKSEEGKCSR